MDKYRSKCKKRRGFHGYIPEKVTTTTQSESMHIQDGDEPDLPLSSVGKTERICCEDAENLKTINKIVPIANSNSSQGPSISGVVSRKMKKYSFKKYHDKFASTRLKDNRLNYITKYVE